jgi:hypothetical protein
MEEGIAASRVKLGLCVHLYGGLAGCRMGNEPSRAEMQEEVRACVYYRCHFLGWGLRTVGGFDLIRFDCRSRGGPGAGAPEATDERKQVCRARVATYNVMRHSVHRRMKMFPKQRTVAVANVSCT